MISYRLICADGHEFDAWLASADAFDRQKAAHLLACALCGSDKVDKAIMAPSVRTQKAKRPAPNGPVTPDIPAPVAASMPPEVLELFRKVRAHVRENAEYVGNRFADEALKIHLDEAKARGIYGEATPDDVRRLADEGVMVHPLPSLPEDKN